MDSSIQIVQASIEQLEELAELFDQYRVFYSQKPDLLVLEKACWRQQEPSH